LKKNPAGEVPLLEWIDRDSKETRLIPESLVVSDYLDNLYPENRLQPADPYLKAKQQVLVGRFGNVNKSLVFYIDECFFHFIRYNRHFIK